MTGVLQSSAKFGFKFKGLWEFLRTIVWSKLAQTGETTQQAAYRGITLWKSRILEKVKSMSLTEFRVFAEENQIEWAPILTPTAVFRSVQAIECGALSRTAEGWCISSPAKFSGESATHLQGHLLCGAATPPALKARL